MPEMPNANDLIATAMQMPLSERVALANAMLNSIDSAADSEATQEEIDAAWDTEIGRRIDDIDSGRVKTVPSSEVWKRIGGKPSGRT
ncbi:putative addiction module component [Rubripirellula reticaptiva]|uniref:Putative addiction module component n=2 Tax=Rubripirellula reticaptiva TaxID=2528013 RepID=A0A5C6EVN7_9BACT|nr:putative addiction module component [Rubripirellula reticaptiva]